MPKYLSGRSKKNPDDQLSADRYKYLSLGDAESNPGDPQSSGISESQKGSVVGGFAPPTGSTAYTLVTYYDDARGLGTRYWEPVGGGIIPGASTVQDEGKQVGTGSSITTFNFVGSALTAVASPYEVGGNSGFIATMTVSPPGELGSVLFKENITYQNWSGSEWVTAYRDDFNTSSDLVFNSSVGILTVGQGINIGVGGTILSVVGVATTDPPTGINTAFPAIVGIGTTNPQYNLHVFGNIGISSGTIYDVNNFGGSDGDIIIKNEDGYIQWKPRTSVVTSAGGTIGNIQFHASGGYVEGASDWDGSSQDASNAFVWDSTNHRVGIGSTQPSAKFDVTGDSKFTGVSTFVGLTSVIDGGFFADDVYVSAASTFVGFSTFKENVWVAGIATIGDIKIEDNKINCLDGNLILESTSATANFVQINDRLLINDATASTTADTGALQVDGGAGINGDLNLGGDISVAGVTTLASSGGITTTGGDLYIGGNLFVDDDIFLDEARVQSLIVNSGVATFHGNVHTLDQVSIGTATFEGSGQLQVSTNDSDGLDVNAYSSTAANGGRLTFYRSKNATIGIGTSVENGDSLGRIDWRGYNENGNAWNQGATIEAEVDGVIAPAASMPSRLVFKTSASGSATPTERLRITSEGKVGIGTTTPDSLLYIKSDDNVAGQESSGITTVLTLETTRADMSLAKEYGPAIRFYNHDNNNNSEAFIQANCPYDYVGGNDAKRERTLDFNFKQKDNGTLKTTMTIKGQGGDVGIGTSTPSSTLHLYNESNDPYLYIQRGNAGDSEVTIGGIYFKNSTNSLALIDVKSDDINDGHMKFHTMGGGTLTERLRITNDGKVLIGTTSDVAPDSFASKLQIESGNSSGSISLGRHTDSGSGPILIFHKSRSGSGAGIATVQNGDLLGGMRFFGADGTDRNSYGASIAVEVDGGVGVNSMPGRLVFGTTASGDSTPTERLRIGAGGTVSISQSDHDGAQTLGADLVVANTTGASIIVGDTGSGEYLRLEGGSGLGRVGTKSNHPLVFHTNGVDNERLRITGIGSVGIGTNNPDKLLTVGIGSTAAYSSDASDTPNLNTLLTLTNKSGTDGIGTGYYSSMRFSIADGATSQGWLSFIRTANNQGDFTFKARNTANDYPELMRIKSDGNVGIGITNPATKTQIHGGDATLFVTGNTAVGSAANTGGTVALGGIYHNNGSITGWAQIKGFKDNNTSNNYNGYLSFTTRDTTDGYIERLRITSAGFVGIGTNNPTTIIDPNNGNTGITTLAVAGIVTAHHIYANHIYGPVTGSLTPDGLISIESYIQHKDYTTTRFGFPDDDSTGNTFVVETGGSERLRITSDGTVTTGIATVTAGVAVTGGELTVGVAFSVGNAGVVTATTFDGTTLKVGTAITAHAGVITATTFDGSLATSNLSGTITNAQLAGSIANNKLVNDSVSYGGVELDLGATDSTPAFDLTDATNYPYTSLTGIVTHIVGDTTPQLGGDLDGNSKSIDGIINLKVSGIATVTDTLKVGTGITANAGVITATTFHGSFTGAVTGNADSATQVYVTDNEEENESNLITFVADAGYEDGNHGLEMDGNLTYNPSTGTVSATGFSGDLTGTLQTGAQTNITSVGTLGSLKVTGISSVGTAITMYGGAGIISATEYYGTWKGNAIGDDEISSSFLKKVEDDATPKLGGDLDGDSKSIDNINDLNVSGVSSVGTAITMSNGIVEATTFKGTLDGNVTGSVGSVTNNVGGSVGSVTGNVGGTVNSATTVTTATTVGSVTGNISGNVQGNVEGNVLGNVVGTATSLSGGTGEFPKLVTQTAANKTGFLDHSADGNYILATNSASNGFEWVEKPISGIGLVEVKQYKEGITERTCSNPIAVTDNYKIGIGSTSNAYGNKFIQTTDPSDSQTVCDGDIWYDPSDGSGGSNISNLPEIDLWTITADSTNTNWDDRDNDILGGGSFGVNIARCTTTQNALFAKQGTGMSYSTGVFTFPSTGTWEVSANLFYRPSESLYKLTELFMQLTTDNSSYSTIAKTYNWSNSIDTHPIILAPIQLTVTNTSLQKIRFTAFSDSTNMFFRGATDVIFSSFSFKKLA